MKWVISSKARIHGLYLFKILYESTSAAHNDDSPCMEWVHAWTEHIFIHLCSSASSTCSLSSSIWESSLSIVPIICLLFGSLLCFSHIRETIQNLSLSVWFIPPSVMIPRCIHFPLNDWGLSFFMAKQASFQLQWLKYGNLTIIGDLWDLVFTIYTTL